MRRLLAGVAGLATLVAIVGLGTASPAASGSWVGRYTLNGGDELALTLSGRQALVALGAGHADLQAVPLSTAGGRIRFQLPGRPAAGRLRRSDRERASSPARSARARLRGTFSARPGSGAGLVARGLYRAGRHARGRRRRPLRPGPARRSRLGQGARALSRRAPASRSAPDSRRAPRRRGPPPSARRLPESTGSTAKRLRVRQLEVRFRSGTVTLAGTLSLPPGSGKHAAVAFVHGSGPTVRAYLPDLSAMLLRQGVAVLVYDKRGNGQSGGIYPGARRPPGRSTPSRAMRRRPRASWPPSRRSIAPASGSRARARRGGSCPSLPHASPPFGSSSSSPDRR